MNAPEIIYLTETSRIEPGPMTGHRTEAEAVKVAQERGQPYVYKLPNQNMWLVATVTK